MSRIIRTLLKRQNVIFGVANSINAIAASAAQNNAHTFVATGNVVSSNILASGYITASGLVEAKAFSGYGTGFSNILVDATAGSNTWTIPNGVRRFKATLIGGGGGGGASAAALGSLGSGGGSGALTIKYYDVAGSVSTVSYNVGGGGVTAGIGNSSNMNYNSTWVFANAGSPGATGTTTVITSAAGGAGGAASGGDLNINGFSGFTGGCANANNSVIGRGGMTPLAWGQGGGTSVDSAGSAGEGYGSGGSGGKSVTSVTTRAGGAGAKGIVIIEW